MNFFSVAFFVSVFFIGCNERHQSNFSENEQLFRDPDSSEFKYEGSSDQDIHLAYKIFQVEMGWGYDIYVNNKRKFHQPHIPAINDLKGFQTKEEAEKVAMLAIHKIKKGQFPPGVTVQELDSLNINYLNINHNEKN